MQLNHNLPKTQCNNINYEETERRHCIVERFQTVLSVVVTRVHITHVVKDPRDLPYYCKTRKPVVIVGGGNQMKLREKRTNCVSLYRVEGLQQVELEKRKE